MKSWFYKGYNYQFALQNTKSEISLLEIKGLIQFKALVKMKNFG
jgi:hypothetical protein